MCDARTLATPKYDWEFVIHTNASGILCVYGHKNIKTNKTRIMQKKSGSKLLLLLPQMLLNTSVANVLESDYQLSLSLITPSYR